MNYLHHVISKPVVDFATKCADPKDTYRTPCGRSYGSNAQDLTRIAMRTAIAAGALLAISKGYGIALALGATAALSFPATVMAAGAFVAFEGAKIAFAAAKAQAAMALFKGAAIYLAGVFIINQNAETNYYCTAEWYQVRSGLLEQVAILLPPENERYAPEPYGLLITELDYISPQHNKDAMEHVANGEI